MHRHTKFFIVRDNREKSAIQLIASIGKKTKQCIVMQYLDTKQAILFLLNSKLTISNTHEDKINILIGLLESLTEAGKKNLIVEFSDLNEPILSHRGLAIDLTPSSIIIEDNTPITTKRQDNRNQKLNWKESTINRKQQNTNKKLNFPNQKYQKQNKKYNYR